MTIRAVIFDCFGVLTTDRWKEFTATLPPDVSDRARELSRTYNAGLINAKQFNQQIEEITGRLPDFIEIMTNQQATKNGELLAYISQLKAKGYKIGLISNVATNWIRDTFLSAAEQALFDDMVLSFEVGMVKPDERIYLLAASQLGLSPGECVFVDDIERFCIGANDVGMRSVLYQDFVGMKAQLDQLLTS